nr:pentatricopeptide repeat-containing protein At4g04790, mitochondrial-like [Ipomoea batatas]
MPASAPKNLAFLLRCAARLSSTTFPATAKDSFPRHCFSSSSAINRFVHSSSSPSEPLSDIVAENSGTCSSGDGNRCDHEDPTTELARELSSLLCVGIDSDLVSSPKSQVTNDDKSLENVLGVPWTSSISHCNVSFVQKEVSQEMKQKWTYKSSQQTHLECLTDLCAKKMGTEDSDLVNSPESQATNGDESLENVLGVPWISNISYDNVSLYRKEVSRERKRKWTYKSSRRARLDCLTNLCAKQMGTDATILVLGKLGRETGLKEYNAIISLSVEKARKMDTVEESLEQLSNAYKYLQAIKERGFQLEEETYGPVLMFFIDFGMVPEFHFFCELIRDGNAGSLPKLAYYEMLLCIKTDNQDKIEELLYSLALYDGEDKYAFQENYLLAMCNSGCKKGCMRLLNTVDITSVASVKHLSNIFKLLGKLMLETFAEKCFLDLKTTDIGAENISSFIYEYTTSMPNLMVEDVVLKFKNLHSELDVALTSEQCEKLIRFSCELLKVHTALNIVDQMIEAGLSLSTGTFNLILDACEDSCEYNLVRQMYLIISSHDLKPNNETFQKLIHLSVKMKDFDGAYKMIKDLGKLNLLPTVNMYNAIMAGYFREKNIRSGLMVLKQMEHANVKPDSQTFSYLLNNCKSEEDIIKLYNEMNNSGVEVTKHVYMSLINAYAACGQFEKAKQVILDERIPIKSLNEVKSVLVSALASHGQISDALDIYEEIKQTKCNRTPKTVISLIEHLQSEGELDRLLHLLDELDDRDYQVDASFRVISYCIRHEQFRPVIGLLKKLKEMYCHDEVAREVLFDEVFCLVAEKEPINLEIGWSLLQTIKNELGVLPSRKSLDFLLSACISAKCLPFCFKIWGEYRKAGLPYNTLNYLRMYQVLLASGLQKPAVAILRKIPKEDPHVCYVIEECQKTYRKGRNKRNKAFVV